MRVRFLVTVAVTMVVLCGWQDPTLANLKLTKQAFENAVTEYANASLASDGDLRVPWAGRAVTQSLLVMTDGARAAAVKDLGVAAKAFVMSPAFGAAYEAYLKKSRNAVNHGIQVSDPMAGMNAAAASGKADALEDAKTKMLRDAMQQSIAPRLRETDKMTKQMIDVMADADAGMAEMIPAKTAADKARQAKAKAMFSEAKQLAGTDIVKARAVYKNALMLAAGLENEAQAAAGETHQQKQEQQQNYNRLALRPILKKSLLRFLAVAKTVDFKAALQDKGGKRVFVNPEYERKSSLWKMLYRLGPGGTGAAVAVAQGWASEL